MARALGEDPGGRRIGTTTMSAGAMQWSPTPQGAFEAGRPRPLGRGRIGQATAMAVSDKDDESDVDREGPHYHRARIHVQCWAMR